MVPDPIPVEPVVHEPPLNPEIRELLERVDLMLVQDNDANLYLAEKIDGFADRLDTMAQLGGYVTRTGQFELHSWRDRIVELTKQFPDTTATSADEETSPESPPGPPFRLIAIDRWEKKWRRRAGNAGQGDNDRATVLSRRLAAAVDRCGAPHRNFPQRQRQ